ncbi:MAG: methyltransferase domain-containing protein [Lentisphaerae bacterium]|nr:MAG: methyltransferase domain-containing protein [Lentisphaerota bacterium]
MCTNVLILQSFQQKLWERLPDHLELDLGCGKGRFTLALAQRYPNHTVIGVDRQLGRLRKLLSKANRRNVSNITAVYAQLWTFVAFYLPDACADRIHILCPDPWPKKKHAPHRTISSEFVGMLGCKLKAGGILHLATDNVPYRERMERIMQATSEFVPAPHGIDDIRDLKTDFELRFERDGIHVWHAAWQKKGRT